MSDDDVKPTTRRNRQADPDSIIRLLVTEKRGEAFVIDIPATWKVTFGAVNPGAPGHHDLHCLRIYEGEKLRGVYCDVRGFRDLSIPMARRVVSDTRSSEWTNDSMGNFKSSSSRELGDSSWIPEDEAPEDIFGPDIELVDE